GASATFPGPSLTAIVFTDATGIALSPVLTANGIAGSYSVAATIPGIGSPVSFSLSNTPGGAETISAFAGTPRNATVGTAYTTPPEAMVRDVFGNGVPGASVTFGAPATTGPSGTFGGTPIATTNAAGVATAPTFTADTFAGSFQVSASTPIGRGGIVIT